MSVCESLAFTVAVPPETDASTFTLPVSEDTGTAAVDADGEEPPPDEAVHSTILPAAFVLS